MLLTAFILIIVLGAVFDFVRVLLLYALVWLAPIGAAMATLQVMLPRYPNEPMIVFWVVVIAAIGVRCLIEVLAIAVRRVAS